MNNNFNPKVSIVIPVYNGANYMREAIDSALAQTYKNTEVLVVNDGSKDETEEIAKSYGDKIRYFAKPNGGVASALNLGLREMQGEYFSWLSHDDAYHPQKIEKQINYLASAKEKDILLYSSYDFMDPESKVMGPSIYNLKLLEQKPEYALLRGWVNGITLLIPKKAFEEYGFFKENLRCTQDYEKWHEMQKTYRFIHLPVALAKYRVHSAQDTKVSPNVSIEGDALWVRMIDETPLETKKRLEGSDYQFHREMAVFLRGTPYKKAAEYAKEKADEELRRHDWGSRKWMRLTGPLKSQEYKNKLKFALFSPKKFLKKYFRAATGKMREN